MKEYQLGCCCYSKSMTSNEDFETIFNTLKTQIPPTHSKFIVHEFLNKILFGTNVSRFILILIVIQFHFLLFFLFSLILTRQYLKQSLSYVVSNSNIIFLLIQE
jgi:hypothetical protein